MAIEDLLNNNDVNSNESYEVKISGNGKTENVGLGDMIWIRLRGSLWWPAQVVDGKTLSKANKPRKRSAGEVLVRLYGSYMYRYVDPVKCRSEFEKILEKYDGNCTAIFENTLQKDRALLRSKSTKGNNSDSQGEVQSDSKGINRTPETAPNVNPPELSARRVRVMQNLGLVAPDGSPFIRKGPCV